MCLSGLIDANSIPENERQNIQVNKKARKVTENKGDLIISKIIYTIFN